MRQNLPWLLAALPFVSWGFSALTSLKGLSVLRGVSDVLLLVLLFPFMLAYDALGVARWNALDTTPHPGRDLVYVVSCAVVLGLLGWAVRTSLPSPR